jgi:hypothetical protein
MKIKINARIDPPEGPDVRCDICGGSRDIGCYCYIICPFCEYDMPRPHFMKWNKSARIRCPRCAEEFLVGE